MNLRQSERVWVLYPEGDGKWGVDGDHSPDTDLSRTYGILRRLGVGGQFLKLTIDARGWPSVEDVTIEAHAAPLARPLPSMPGPPNPPYIPGDLGAPSREEFERKRGKGIEPFGPDIGGYGGES